MPPLPSLPPPRPALLAETAAYGAITVLPTVSYLVKGGASYQMIIRATPDCAHVDAQSRPRTPHSRARVRVLLTALSWHCALLLWYAADATHKTEFSSTPGHGVLECASHGLRVRSALGFHSHWL